MDYLYLFIYKTGTFMGQMLVNIPYMKHMVMIFICGDSRDPFYVIPLYGYTHGDSHAHGEHEIIYNGNLLWILIYGGT